MGIVIFVSILLIGNDDVYLFKVVKIEYIVSVLMEWFMVILEFFFINKVCFIFWLLNNGIFW